MKPNSKLDEHRKIIERTFRWIYQIGESKPPLETGSSYRLSSTQYQESKELLKELSKVIKDLDRNRTIPIKIGEQG